MATASLTINNVCCAQTKHDTWDDQTHRIVVGYTNSTSGKKWYVGCIKVSIPASVQNKVTTKIEVVTPLSGDSRVSNVLAVLSTSKLKPTQVTNFTGVASASPMYDNNGSLTKYPSGWSSGIGNKPPHFIFNLQGVTLDGDTDYYIYFYSTSTSTGSNRTALHGVTDTHGKYSKYSVSATYIDTYTIVYDSNGGSGGPSSQTKNHDTSITLSATKPTKNSQNLTPYAVTLDYNYSGQVSTTLGASVTRSFKFKNWNTKKDGTGKSYLPGDTYSGNTDATLYAQYSQSDSVGSISLPTPTRAGYTIKGWYSGSSLVGNAGSSYTPSGSVTLQAHWSENYVEITYDADGGSQKSSDFTLPVKNRVYYSQVCNDGNGLYDVGTFGLYKNGYHFADSDVTWTDKNGHNLSQSSGIDSGRELAELLGVSIDNGVETVNLYPRWAPNTATVLFHSNGASSGVHSMSAKAKYNTAFTGIKNKISEMGLTKVGHHINDGEEWVTPTGKIVPQTSSGKDGQTFISDYFGGSLESTDGETYTLYANWEVNTYKVSYKVDGVELDISTTVKHGNSLSISYFVPEKNGYRFKHWESDTGVAYLTGDVVTAVTSDIVLTAIWQPVLEVNFYGQVSLISEPVLIEKLEVVAYEDFSSRLPKINPDTHSFTDGNESVEVLFLVDNQRVAQLTVTKYDVFSPTGKWSDVPYSGISGVHRHTEDPQYVTESTNYYIHYNHLHLLSNFNFPEYAGVAHWEWASEQYHDTYLPGSIFPGRYISANPTFNGELGNTAPPVLPNSMYVNTSNGICKGVPYVKVNVSGELQYVLGVGTYVKVNGNWVPSST